jgi:endonuclease III
MKDNSQYAARFRRFYSWLRRGSTKTEKVFYEEPLEAVVYALISEDTTSAEAHSAAKRLNGYFVDLNELRVARPDEIVEVLGYDAKAARATAAAVTTVLRTIFNETNTLSLKGLRKTGKRQARKKLEQINGITGFAIDYCMLTSLKGHAVPLTGKMTDYLRTNELTHPQADEKDIAGFLTKQVRAEKAFEFYTLLRRVSESGKAMPKTITKSRSAGKSKPKTKKKTKTRK